ncbi:MAG: c-type cytochrome [Nitrospinota bacterium]|nr:c-type cytochrome [Nitrospinota bacterium]
MRFKFWKQWIPVQQVCLMGLFWLGLVLPGPVVAQQEKEQEKPSGICPQPRKTVTAPDEFLKLQNPLEATPQNILAGKTLFHVDAQPTACRVCHGISGDGLGVLFHRVDPKPRNFTCIHTMDNLPDGQLFWVIKNGSPGTAMPSFSYLEDDQVWELILFLRSFSKKE